MNIAPNPDSVNKPIISQAGNKEALDLWRTVTIHSIRDFPFDLSARQMGVVLIVYSDSEKQTVRGLAAKLAISKPAVTRALDRLTSHKLIKRVRDEKDRRNVYIETTEEGYAFLGKFSETVMSCLMEIV